MSAFEQALKTSVQGLDQGYRVAESAIREEVAAASEAVAKLTNGRARVDLRKIEERQAGPTFSMRLIATASKTMYEIAVFRVSANGYPITVARTLELMNDASIEAHIADRNELTKYFISIASSPDSSLVLRIALLLRQGEASVSEVPF